MINKEDIGHRIRQFRRVSGMTLNDLAKAAGISQGYLSKIENSKNAPPVSTLLMLIRVLDIKMSELFGEESRPRKFSHVKPDERQMVARNGSIFGYSYESIAQNYQDRRMDPYIMTIPADLDRDPDFHFKHRGEEMMFLLEGKMKFFHDEDEYILETGDCIYFDAGVPHNGFCIEGERAVVLMVIYTPGMGAGARRGKTREKAGANAGDKAGNKAGPADR
jgi:transcriptional regulator with XRE-family HTH domain